MTSKQYIILFFHAFIGWTLCGATIAVGRSLTTMQTTLIIHAVAAPLIFYVVSYIYFRNFHYSSALKTSFIFVSFVIAVDAGLVAPFFEKSYEMFSSVLGTWLPFALIFTSTFVTGQCVEKKER